MTRRVRGIGSRGVVGFAAVASLVAAACSHDDASSKDCRCEARGSLVDPVLVAFLSAARSAHHVADELEAKGDLRGAVLRLDALLRTARPGRSGVPAEVREVLADTHARLADLASREGHFDLGEQHVRQGLNRAPGPTYFRGHLLEVLGLVEQRRSKALSDQGRLPEAERARQRAIDAFEQAVDVQEAVIRGALDADAGR